MTSLNEIPRRHADLVDVKRFGPGERIVFEPYTESMYEETQKWIIERGIFDGANADEGAGSQLPVLDDYGSSVVRLSQ